MSVIDDPGAIAKKASRDARSDPLGPIRAQVRAATSCYATRTRRRDGQIETKEPSQLLTARHSWRRRDRLAEGVHIPARDCR